MAPSQVGAFAKSSPDYATANLEFHFQPLSLDKWGDGLHPFGAFTASVCNLRPSSRGSVHLKSPTAEDAPAISPNYLDTDEDKRVAVDALKLARKIVAQAPLARFKPQEHSPGTAGDLGRGAAGSGERAQHHDLPPCRDSQDGPRRRSDGRARRAPAGAGRRACA
jgi:choline dehydrogenase-like flavoprotein